jgi:cyclopropane-fatty-acyl-phospholipid synthase
MSTASVALENRVTGPSGPTRTAALHAVAAPTAEAGPTRLDHAARAVAMRLGGAVTGGRLAVEDWAGRRRFGRWAVDAQDRPPLGASVRVHHPGTYRRLLRRGSVGLGETYAEGWWDTDDLATTLRLLNRAVRRADPARQAVGRVTGPVTDRLRSLRPASRDRDRANVHAHYDLGNEFFAALLDETMAYSCGIFPAADAPLDVASVEKFDRLCRMVGLGPDRHLLEIGTGWGGFAVHAARHYGCRVTTTTISDAQYRHAIERVREAGLADRIEVLPRHYRDVEGRFDAIVAVEMIEAVDWPEYRAFFGACRRLLAPAGRLALQAIVIPERRFDVAKRTNDFIREVIFPGGCLPSIDALTRAAARAADLRMVRLDDVGVHYAETLRRWRANLDAMDEQLPSVGADERFRRLWRFYLAYCEAGFDEREISVVQVAFAGAGWHPGLA